MADLNTHLTQEQRSARGRKAGLKSAEKRREKKRMREWAEVIGSKECSIVNADGSEEVVPYDCAVVASMYQKAIQENDVRAAEFIAKLKGEMEEKVDITSGGKVFKGFADILPVVPNIEAAIAEQERQRKQNEDNE